jgi:hypothetical protein
MELLTLDEGSRGSPNALRQPGDDGSHLRPATIAERSSAWVKKSTEEDKVVISTVVDGFLVPTRPTIAVAEEDSTI